MPCVSTADDEVRHRLPAVQSGRAGQGRESEEDTADCWDETVGRGRSGGQPVTPSHLPRHSTARRTHYPVGEETENVRWRCTAVYDGCECNLRRTSAQSVMRSAGNETHPRVEQRAAGQEVSVESCECCVMSDVRRVKKVVVLRQSELSVNAAVQRGALKGSEVEECSAAGQETHERRAAPARSNARPTAGLAVQYGCCLPRAYLVPHRCSHNVSWSCWSRRSYHGFRARRPANQRATLTISEQPTRPRYARHPTQPTPLSHPHPSSASKCIQQSEPHHGPWDV